MPHTLILIPTEAEASLIRPALQSMLATPGFVVKLCGFGPIASGIRTAQLLAQLRPKTCLLIGIAGGFRTDLAIGSAHEFNQIACYGIGAGSGSNFESSSELGWKQWPEPMKSLSDSEVLYLPNPILTDRELQLLTVCTAAACESDVALRLRAFPHAAAEDMEAFSVGLACRSATVPLKVIRGISNHAGDRDKSNWDMKSALESATSLVISSLKL